MHKRRQWRSTYVLAFNVSCSLWKTFCMQGESNSMQWLEYKASNVSLFKVNSATVRHTEGILEATQYIYKTNINGQNVCITRTYVLCLFFRVELQIRFGRALGAGLQCCQTLWGLWFSFCRSFGCWNVHRIFCKQVASDFVHLGCVQDVSRRIENQECMQVLSNSRYSK